MCLILFFPLLFLPQSIFRLHCVSQNFAKKVSIQVIGGVWGGADVKEESERGGGRFLGAFIHFFVLFYHEVPPSPSYRCMHAEACCMK